MKTQLASLCRPRRKLHLRNRSNHRPFAHHRGPDEIQLIYAHFGPPVVFSATEQFRFVLRSD